VEKQVQPPPSWKLVSIIDRFPVIDSFAVIDWVLKSKVLKLGAVGRCSERAR